MRYVIQKGKTKKRTLWKPELKRHWLLEDPHKIKVPQREREREREKEKKKDDNTQYHH